MEGVEALQPHQPLPPALGAAPVAATAAPAGAGALARRRRRQLNRGETEGAHACRSTRRLGYVGVVKEHVQGMVQ